MRKIFKYPLLFAAAMTLATSMTSCSDSDDDNGDRVKEQNEALEAVTKQYLNAVVYPTYTGLANSADELYNLIYALKNKVKGGKTATQAEVDAICAKYKEARKYWEQSEAFLYGAATDFDIDPWIDTWPLEVDILAKDLNDDKIVTRLDQAAKDGNVAFVTPENRGFHGIEFIFFRDGKNRNVAIFNNDAVENYTYKGEAYFKGMNVTGKEEMAFAAAVAADLRDKVYQLEVAWKGNTASASHVARVNECKKNKAADNYETLAASGLSYGADLLNVGVGKSYSTWKKVMETIFVGGCSNICAEVADQKMGQAYRSAVGQAETHEDEETGELVEDDPNYIESPYSYNSFADFKDNILSIRNSLYGNVGTEGWAEQSIMAYLKKYLPAQAYEMQVKLQSALKALDNCLAAKQAFVQNPGATYVKEAMDKITALDDCLNNVSRELLKN